MSEKRCRSGFESREIGSATWGSTYGPLSFKETNPSNGRSPYLNPLVPRPAWRSQTAAGRHQHAQKPLQSIDVGTVARLIRWRFEPLNSLSCRSGPRSVP